MPDKPISLRFLGRFDLQAPSGDKSDVSGAKTVLLLARLSMSPGQPIDRKRLIEVLWPDRGEAQALASLRQALWGLRKCLGEGDPAPIVAERSDIRLSPDAFAIDTIEFERHARSASRDALERAAALYRGDYLAEFDLGDASEHSPFLYERQRLRDLGLSVLKALVGLRIEAGDLDGAVDVAQRALAIDPLQEDLHGTVMRLHADRGRLGLALAQYETCRELLRRELDVAPSAAIEALRQSLGKAPVLPAPGRALAIEAGGGSSDAPQPVLIRWRILPLAVLALSVVAGAILLVAYLAPSRAPPLASNVAASEVRRSGNLEAYDYYLRAENQATDDGEAETFRRSLAAYHRAIDLDPGFADAYAGLARLAVMVWRGDFNEILPSAVAKREAYEAAGKALALDPDNARAYAALSVIEAVDGEDRAAVASASKAVELEPGNAEAHANLATVLYYAGDLEAATAEVEVARQLDPTLPTDLRLASGIVAFADRRYAEAIEDLTPVRETVPRSELVLEHLAAAYAYLGETARAREIVAELRALLPITNLSFYRVMRANIGTPAQTEHFVEGLRLAGVPVWPFDDQRRPEDRVGPADLDGLVKGVAWTGRLQNGVQFAQYFDKGGGFAYRSSSSLLSGKTEVRDGQLCQRIAGYLLDHESCGYVYHEASAGESYAYVSIDAVKHFSLSK